MADQKVVEGVVLLGDGVATLTVVGSSSIWVPRAPGAWALDLLDESVA
jgi:hypothetical protein